MKTSVKLFGPIRQVAWLVEDLDTSMQQWMSQARVGPWTCYRNVAMTGECRGRATTVSMDVGLSYQDDVQIELIQVRNDSPSPYRDAEGRVLLGMHHVASLSSELDADIARAQERGLTMIFRAGNAATRVAYFTMTGAPSVMLELIEATPPILDGFAAGQAACEAWDGRPQVQEIDLAAPGTSA